MPDIDLQAIRDRAYIRDLAEDGGNKAAEYWLRAHQAEQERDQAEAEADRLRGLLAEAEKGVRGRESVAWEKGRLAADAWHYRREDAAAAGGYVQIPNRRNPYREEQ